MNVAHEYKGILFSLIKEINPVICNNMMDLEDIASSAAKSLQLCPTLCDPIDSSSPVSSVPGILQARTLEWVSITFSNA